MALNSKIVQIMDAALGLLAFVLGAGLILSGLNLSFVNAVTGPLTSGMLGLVVGIIFLFHALRYYKVIR